MRKRAYQTFPDFIERGEMVMFLVGGTAVVEVFAIAPLLEMNVLQRLEGDRYVPHNVLFIIHLKVKETKTTEKIKNYKRPASVRNCQPRFFSFRF